jgi:hypothetical protein
MVCDDVNFVKCADLFIIRNKFRNERAGWYFWAQKMGWGNLILAAHILVLINNDIV